MQIRLIVDAPAEVARFKSGVSVQVDAQKQQQKSKKNIQKARQKFKLREYLTQKEFLEGSSKV